MTSIPTLFDDWQARREQLSHLSSSEHDYRAIEGQVLDFLLRRYRNTPEGNRPARFHLTRGLYINHRAIVVLHHLAGGRDAKIATPAQAQTRVQAVLAKMHRPPDHEFIRTLDDEPDDSQVWQAALETLRMNLCDTDSLKRVYSIAWLGEDGELDDIGLLSDLLALPPSIEEHLLERPAMLHAMQQLAGVVSEPFDLSNLLGTKPGQAKSAVLLSSESPVMADAPKPDWKCPKCGDDVPSNFQICWSCGYWLNGSIDQILPWNDETERKTTE